MHDIVFRGGTIHDGAGTKGFAGDVAINGVRIAQVGGKAGPGRREIDADGLLATPGWVICRPVVVRAKCSTPFLSSRRRPGPIFRRRCRPSPA
jgi:predicted amidohydrolase